MISEHDLEKLQENGIEFIVHLFDGYWHLSPKEIFEYIDNPELFEAKAHGVDLESWRKWKRHCENPRCSAITKKGVQCKNEAYIYLNEYILNGCKAFCKIHNYS